MRLCHWVSILILVLVGCTADPEEEKEPVDVRVEMDRSVGDMFTDAAIDKGLEPVDMAGMDSGPLPDQGIPPDMAPPTPDARISTPIDSCQAVCDRYTTCERLGDVFGGEDTCLATCERLSRSEPPSRWWRCVENEACNLLHVCRVPDIEPLGCEEVCGLAGGECGLNVGEACLETCETGGEPFRLCGESLLAGCDTAEFVSCLATDVYQMCRTSCDRGVMCNVTREEGCVEQCVEAYLEGDPLARARAQALGQCVSLANEDCSRVNDCFNPPDPNREVAEAAFCALYDQCQFRTPCNGMYNNLRGSGPAALRCAEDMLQFGCPRGEFEIERQCLRNQGNPVGAACGQLCAAQDLCEVLPEGVGRAMCIQTCNESNNGLNPDELERQGQSIACGSAANCPELVTCLNMGSPAEQCMEHCNQLGLCEAEPAGCVAACDAVWPRDRQEEYRSCVAMAVPDCDAVIECAPAPQIPCNDYCARGAECGAFPGGEDCVNQCDDAHFAEPITMGLRVACVLAAEACNGPDEITVEACVANPEVGGRDCLNFCRATTECAENAVEDLGSCLTRCVSGLGNAEGLVMEAAGDCLAAAAINAACPVILACLPEVVEVDCDAHCARLEACQIPGDCAAECAGLPDANAAGCAVDALRTHQQCGGVAACVGYEPEPATPACSGLCAAQKECDSAVDPYLCRSECTPPDEALPVQLACVEASLCPDLPACLALDAEIDPACADLCDSAVACGVFEEAAECMVVCTGQQASPRARDTYIADVSGCVDRAEGENGCDVETARACFTPAFCETEAPVVVVPVGGGRFNFDNRNRMSFYQAQCGARAGGPETIYILTIGRRTRLRAEIVQAAHDTVLHIRSACDDMAAEIECDDDGGDGVKSLIDRNLEPGTYYLFADGFGNAAGVGVIEIQLQ